MEIFCNGDIEKSMWALRRMYERSGLRKELRLKSIPKVGERRKEKDRLARMRRKKKENHLENRDSINERGPWWRWVCKDGEYQKVIMPRKETMQRREDYVTSCNDRGISVPLEVNPANQASNQAFMVAKSEHGGFKIKSEKEKKMKDADIDQQETPHQPVVRKLAEQKEEAARENICGRCLANAGLRIKVKENGFSPNYGCMGKPKYNKI